MPYTISHLLMLYTRAIHMLTLTYTKYTHTKHAHNAHAQSSQITLAAIMIIMLMSCNTTQSITRTNSKILIITPTSNHPEYITLQDLSFKKYLQDAYEFIVFNDAIDEKTIKEIDATCATLNIQSIRVPQENRPIGTVVSWASYRHGQTLNYIMESIAATRKNIVAIIDSDMFLIKKFSIVDYLKGYDIAGLGRGPDNDKMAYMWPGLLFFRMQALPNKNQMNFMPEDNLHFDTGGSLCHYFQANPSIKIKLFSHGRLKLNKDLTPFDLHSSPCRGYSLKCASCTEKIQKKQKPINAKCIHKKSIYKHLQFRDSVIDLLMTNKIPFAAEFILGDTFFHISGSSGYYNWSETDIENRNLCMNNFTDSMLNL